METLVERIRAIPGCRVLGPAGLPAVGPGHRLPASGTPTTRSDGSRGRTANLCVNYADTLGRRQGSPDWCHTLAGVSPRRARRLAAEVRRRPRGGAERAGKAGSQAAGASPGSIRGEQPAARLGPPQTQNWPDGDWVVRQVPGAAAVKTYRCPGCDQEIIPGAAHVVVWPAEAPGPEERRHWHNSCWQRRPRRPGPWPAARW